MAGFFSGDKKIPSISFWGYLFGAVAVDILLCDWLPGAGTAFVLFCRGMYMINGYKTDKMLTTTAVNAVIGFVPILADVTSIVFVVTSYRINAAETKRDEEAAAGAARQAIGYATARSGGAAVPGLGARGNARNPSEGRGNQNAGYAPRETRGASVSAPTTAADKNMGYRNTERGNAPKPGEADTRNVGYGSDKSVDGVKRPEMPTPHTQEYRPTQPVFKQRPSSNNESLAQHAA